ncbi:hypothetical protein PATY110618_06595 [Paenibacillus typhae]|uniref:Uncharacterized protein n=1 Tax=Paenibacillus typhae TaxID=1174501 RepID=A0A1G8FHV3_9BACL|nr:hypothetical protein SAMN05216192_101246 [Paenibacillus typhae]
MKYQHGRTDTKKSSNRCGLSFFLTTEIKNIKMSKQFYNIMMN